MAIFEGKYSESNTTDVEELSQYLLAARQFTNDTTSVTHFSGNLSIDNGAIQQAAVTLFHTHSLAEDVTFYTTC